MVADFHNDDELSFFQSTYLILGLLYLHIRKVSVYVWNLP